jgi:hypothetical protein
MTLRTFMFATDALRLEDGVGFAMPNERGVPAPAPADTKAQNAQSMQMLNAMMAGTQKRKTARR